MPTKTKSTKAKKPVIVDIEAYDLLSQLKAAKEVRGNAKALEDELADKVKLHMAKYESEMGSHTFLIVHSANADGVIEKTVWDLNLVQGTNVSLSSDKLRERGVDPEIIGFATKRTPYVSVTLKKVGE